MRYRAVKEFEVEEASLRNGWYQILVFEVRTGNLVHRIEQPTMQAALDDFTRLGYRKDTTMRTDRSV